MRNLFKLKNHENQRGVAAVEFALILPILVLLLAGIIEFSLLLYNQQVITNASREGARIAINPDNVSFGVIQEIVTDYCDQKLINFGQPGNLTVTCQINDGTVGTNCSRNFEDDVKIIVEYTYYFLLPQIIRLGTDKQIKAATSMNMM